MGINTPKTLPLTLLLASLVGCQNGSLDAELAIDAPELGEQVVVETSIATPTAVPSDTRVQVSEVLPVAIEARSVEVEVDDEPTNEVQTTATDVAVDLDGAPGVADAYVPPSDEFLDRLLTYLPWAEPFLSDAIFRRVVLLAFFMNPNSVDAGDLDGDGDLDLLWAQTQHDRVFIFSQIAPGSFAPSPALVGAREFTEMPVAVAAIDVDGDGRTDVVSANAQGDELTVFFQIGFGVFQPSPAQAAAPGDVVIHSLHGEDLDSDGDLDLAICAADGAITAAFEQVRPRIFVHAPALQ